MSTTEKQAKYCRTKICAIRTCKHAKGTRDGIQMFTVPAEESRVRDWCKSAGLGDGETLRGFVCIEHFAQNVLIPATASRNIRLKPNAIPTIFHEITKGNDKIDGIIDNEIQPNSKRTNLECNVIRSKYDELMKEFVFMRTNYDVKFAQMEIKINFLEEKVRKNQTELSSLRDARAYAKNKNNDLKCINKELVAKNECMKGIVDVWEKVNRNEVLKCMAFGIKKGESYPKEVRKFCLELQFQKPSAYRFVRTSFDNHLPHERTISLWYQFSNINQGNGICKEAFDRLKRIVEQSNEEPLICTLTFDEIFIRKQILHCRETSSYVGYITYGSGVKHPKEVGSDSQEECEEGCEEIDDHSDDEEELPCANQAIVFMLCGLNKRFKLPIAYEFITSLNAFQRASLIMSIIKNVTDSGVRIANLTFDGLTANHKMCEILGANLNIESADFAPFFYNPIDKNKIHIIKDPSHMQKLIRNTLGYREVLFDEKNGAICWRHIENLEKLGRKKEFLTHKLTKRHIQFKKSIMDVQISRETLSSLVADSLQFLHDNEYGNFKNCQSTIRFIRLMDTLASICNSYESNEIDPFKSPMNPENIRIIRSFFSECLSYIKSIKLIDKQKGRKVPVIKTPRRTGFIGMIINIKSFISMYEEYIEGGLMVNFPTYSASQDHLEAFFSRIRARQGSNDNPNVLEFKGAWRKLLCGNLDHVHTEHSNIRILDPASNINLPFTNIYTISSRRPELGETEKQKIKETAGLVRDEILKQLKELELSDDSNSGLNLAKASIAFTAKSIEENIGKYHFNCHECKNIFNDNLRIDDCFSKAKDLNPPCVSTFVICETADKFLKLHTPSKSQKHDFNVLYFLIFKELDYEALYTKSKHFDECKEHKFYLIKSVVNEYVESKLSQWSDQRTLIEHDKILRKAYKKATHFAGQ